MPLTTVKAMCAASAAAFGGSETAQSAPEPIRRCLRPVRAAAGHRGPQVGALRPPGRQHWPHRGIRRVSQQRFHVPTPRFPPLGPPGAVPQLPRYYQGATTSCRPSRRASFPSLGGTTVHSFVSLPADECRRRGLELVTRYPRPGCCRGDDRISQVPGEPRLSVCPCSSDPGRTDRIRPLRCRSVAPGMRTTKAPAKGLSRLNRMAFGLAVYASQAGLPRHHARLASGCWPGSPGRAFHPQGSIERFQICFLHLILLSQASWRNAITCCASQFLRQPPYPVGWSKHCLCLDRRTACPGLSYSAVAHLRGLGVAMVGTRKWRRRGTA